MKQKKIKATIELEIDLDDYAKKLDDCDSLELPNELYDLLEAATIDEIRCNEIEFPFEEILKEIKETIVENREFVSL